MIPSFGVNHLKWDTPYFLELLFFFIIKYWWLIYSKRGLLCIKLLNLSSGGILNIWIRERKWKNKWCWKFEKFRLRDQTKLAISLVFSFSFTEDALTCSGAPIKTAKSWHWARVSTESVAVRVAPPVQVFCRRTSHPSPQTLFGSTSLSDSWLPPSRSWLECLSSSSLLSSSSYFLCFLVCYAAFCDAFIPLHFRAGSFVF